MNTNKITLTKLTILIAFMALLVLMPLISMGCAKKSDKFKVALTGKFPPFSFYSNKGELIGFDVDIANKIGEELGKEVEFVTVEWDGILAGLLSNKYDCIISSMAITPERKEKVLFSTPYYYSGAQLFVHKETASDIKSIEDMKGKKIGVVLGETYEQYMRTNHPDIEIVTFKGSPTIFEEMKNKRIDGFVTDRLVGLYQIKSAKRDFAPVGDMLYRETLAIPVQKDNKELGDKINAAINKINENGELDKIHMKWFGKKPDYSSVEETENK